MNEMTTFQPSARMVAVLNRSLKERKIAARWSDELAPFATSQKAVEMVTKGFSEFLEAAKPFTAQWGDPSDQTYDPEYLSKIVSAASGSISEAQSSDDVFSALSEALQEEEAAKRPAPRISVDGRDFGNMTPAQIRASDAGHENLSARMTDGLLARLKPGHTPTIGREFAEMSLFDCARYCVESNGQRLWGRSKATVVEMAMHTTSDFPDFLQSTSNRILVDSYEAAESALKMVSQELQLQDFRAVNNLKLGAAADLEEVKEDGEVTFGSIETAKESIRLINYAKGFTLTRQAIVNDDLAAFDRLLPEMGQAAARKEAQILASLLEENDGSGPTMSDDSPLFDATHGNIALAGAPISVATISEARTAMRRQKGLGGEPINVNPAYLIVPPELETSAQQVVSDIFAAQVGDVNPFSQRMQVLSDPHLTDEWRWYLAAAPGTPVGLQHAYLQGEPGPQLFTQQGFDVEGMKFKVRLDFGAAFADWRAWFMNPQSDPNG